MPGSEKPFMVSSSGMRWQRSCRSPDAGFFLLVKETVRNADPVHLFRTVLFSFQLMLFQLYRERNNLLFSKAVGVDISLGELTGKETEETDTLVVTI